MPRPALSALLTVGLVVLGVAMTTGACAGGGEGPGGAGSTTGAGGTGGGTSSSASTGGAGGGGAPPVNPCDTLCQHVSDIACMAWTTCPTDCADKLGAPPDCTDAFDALLDCWTKNLDTFTCTSLQLLPPAACQDLAEAFRTCVTPSTGPVDACICSVGVGNSSVSNCARKITCGADAFAAVCQEDASGSWVCSCYDNDTLLGTCTEAASVSPHCDAHQGCCVPYFCAP